MQILPALTLLVSQGEMLLAGKICLCVEVKCYSRVSAPKLMTVLPLITDYRYMLTQYPILEGLEMVKSWSFFLIVQAFDAALAVLKTIPSQKRKADGQFFCKSVLRLQSGVN